MAVTPSNVLELTQPTPSFLCSLADNTFQIDFIEFCIRDLDTPKGSSEIFAVRQSEPLPACVSIPDDIEDPEFATRCIRYDFGASFLSRKSIGAKLVFKVGEEPLPGFRMIERHYFKDQLIKSFDFTLGFCMPNSTNEWEVMYTVPSITEELKNAMIDNPFDTRSDTFYFVNDRLIIDLYLAKFISAVFAYSPTGTTKPSTLTLEARENYAFFCKELHQQHE